MNINLSNIDWDKVKGWTGAIWLSILGFTVLSIIIYAVATIPGGWIGASVIIGILLTVWAVVQVEDYFV